MSKKSLNIINNASPANTSFEGAEGKDSTSDVSRRDFLKVLGAGAALGLSACADSTKQKVFPDLKGDGVRNPGVAVWYNSTCRECEAGCGITVRTREGRAVKIEGNKNHPINKGGLCAVGQASLQGLYDPDRIREPLQKELDSKGVPYFKAISWSDAISQLSKALKKDGKKYIIRGEETGSLEKLFSKYSSEFDVKSVVWDITTETELAESSKRVFGSYGIPHHDFSKADFILSFGANFLETWVSPVEYARGFAEAKRKKVPVKFFHVEPRLSLTASNADLWLKSKPGTDVEIVKYLIAKLLKAGKGKNLSSELLSKMPKIANVASTSEASGLKPEKLKLMFDSLVSSKKSLIVAGGTSASFSSELYDLVNILNLLLANVGKTVFPSISRKPQSSLSSVLEVSKNLNSEAAELLITYNTDPVLNLPVDAGFKYGAKKSKLHVSFSSHFNETTRLADIILPASTSLESWGDASPHPGVRSLIQPVMKSVFNTKEVGDILIETSKKADQAITDKASFRDVVKSNWLSLGLELKVASTENFWRDSLERGGYFSKASRQAKIDSSAFNSKSKKVNFIRPKGLSGEKLILYPYSSIRDFSGRFANRPWLQELPDPVTKIVWSSWAEVNTKTAKKLGLASGDTVSVSNHYGEVQLPVYTTSYVSEGILAVPVSGSGEQGRYADQAGNGNVYSLLGVSANKNSLGLLSTEVSVSRSRVKRKLVQTQGSDSQMDRGIAETEYISTKKDTVGHDEHSESHDSHGGHASHHKPEQMYEQRQAAIYDWGMNIDLASCTGCSACVVACYAENNISVVGKEICDQGREMSWLRIERYYDGDEEDPKAAHLPMMCQHCDNAPCEPVCPVYATYHNEEGLNAMIYNRCVGTRYCGNNCSYKVRRYNWFEFDYPEPLNLQLNPDVTKREAGVMEKCSFCVQRITEAKDTAKDEGRLVQDGEIQPACAQSCPTKAITFGNRKDRDSNVSKLGGGERAYKVLDHHLNTQPSVTYLKNRKHKV